MSVHKHDYLVEEGGIYKHCECGDVRIMIHEFENKVLHHIEKLAIDEAERWWPNKSIESRIEKMSEEFEEFAYEAKTNNIEEMNKEAGDVLFVLLHTLYVATGNKPNLVELLSSAVLKIKHRTSTGQYLK